jgi:hypothetical protein
VTVSNQAARIADADGCGARLRSTLRLIAAAAKASGLVRVSQHLHNRSLSLSLSRK